ncbi:MAG: hypothetical protein EPN88_00145 [Bacteroidetes bacterium]|nr:MAG: hypothetical protein EPN88_00145 [Bacteroidota bacterium]
MSTLREPTPIQESDVILSLKIGRPLRVTTQGSTPSSTSELFECTSLYYPNRPLVLKVANTPVQDGLIETEAESLTSLNKAKVPYVVTKVASGAIKERYNRMGLVEYKAAGVPISPYDSYFTYGYPTELKTEAIDRYLEMLTKAGDINYALRDLQAEAIFIDRPDPKGKEFNMTVVDFGGGGIHQSETNFCLGN